MTALFCDATAITDARIEFRYQDTWDLKSVRRWVYRNLPALDDGPYVYIQPLEGEFKRPSVTIQLVRSTPSGPGQSASRSYGLDHTLALQVYGRTRDETIMLGQAVWRLFEEGGVDKAPYRIPMWEFRGGLRLARWMRVNRGSLSMGLDATDDEGLWQRPITVTVSAPRLRSTDRGIPLVGSVSITQNA